MAWAVFSHPSVTMASLASFVWWQLSDMMSLAMAAVGGVISRAITLVGGEVVLETLTSSPVALGAVKQQYPDYEVVESGVERTYSEFLHGYHTMPIEFSAR